MGRQAGPGHDRPSGPPSALGYALTGSGSAGVGTAASACAALRRVRLTSVPAALVIASPAVRAALVITAVPAVVA